MSYIPLDLTKRFPGLAPPPKPTQPAPVDRTAIVLGKDHRRTPAVLPLMTRQEHILMLGSTGSGKSRALLHIMRQAISLGEGVAFIDPHGTDDYRDLLVWLNQTRKRVHIIDFNAATVTGFNPLHCPEDTDPSVIVGNVMDALSAVWDGESMAAKPSIERVMSAVFAALIELKLTICEAEYLLDKADGTGLRRYAIEHVKDNHTRGNLKRLHELANDPRRTREFEQEVLGPLNRLERLIKPPRLRAMLGQTAYCVDFKSVMDNGDIVLANLSGGTKVYEKDADVFGRLLTRTVLFHAKRRKAKTPFNFVMDEAPRYLSGDVSVLLAEVRKYGCSIIASMQWLNQAKSVHEDILAALLNGTNCKISFRLRNIAEAEEMAKSMIPLNLERPVEALIKPAVIGHKLIKLNSQSTSEQESTTKGRALALGETETEGETVTKGIARNHSVTNTTNQSKSTAQISTKAKGKSTGEGTQAAEVMIPTDDPSAPLLSRTTAGLSSNKGSSSSTATGTVKGHIEGTGQAITDGITESESIAFSRSLAKSRVETASEAETRGTGATKGTSEAFEPIMANLPSAVHSMQNELYAAGRLLCSLKRGTGYVSYVGQNGPVNTLFSVPFLRMPQVSDEQFIALRDRFMSSALPLTEALQVIADRAASFAKSTLTPKPTQKPKDNPQADHSEPGEY